ncbi:Na+/H+ antiporter NhaA [Sphingomonas adhaesiva]|uniref:Na+/H+ antiporter NhaA n=1 Tax=Sphingomonas adhaesiva TaxID=28212 RepID=UPI002FF5E730
MTTPSPRPATGLRAFLSGEAAGGVVLIGAAALALLAANLPATAAAYDALVHAATGPVLAPDHGPMTVHLWVNDALMALFFLLVGLEIKRELVAGELASWERRRLPFVAAACGMAAPAAVFLAIAGTHPDLTAGWAIPAATDIAFALGVMALLGPRVPASLKLLLATIAIVDDLGAVAIIALAYTDALHMPALAAAAGLAAALVWLNRRGTRALSPYLLIGALLWWCVLRSGVHATVAGVVLAMTIPIGEGARGPLARLEHALHPWSAFAIVPLFAFVNAGVDLRGVTPAALAHPLVLGIAAGLFLGKQIGIFGGICAAAWLGIARAPAGIRTAQLYGLSLLAGIGFTMSLFIGALAFPDAPTLATAVKLGVLTGSLLSGAAGALVLWWAGRARH